MNMDSMRVRSYRSIAADEHVPEGVGHAVEVRLQGPQGRGTRATRFKRASTHMTKPLAGRR